jgi:hypothetical protein
MVGLEAVFAAVVALATLGAREWRRVQLAREQRRHREQELLVQLAKEIAEGGGSVQVRHRSVGGQWSISSDAEDRQKRSATGRETASPGRRR